MCLTSPELLPTALSDFIDDDMRLTSLAMVNKAWNAEANKIVDWMMNHPGLTKSQKGTLYIGLTLPSHVVNAANQKCSVCDQRYVGQFHDTMGTYAHANCLTWYMTHYGRTLNPEGSMYGVLPMVESSREFYNDKMAVCRKDNNMVPWQHTVEGYKSESKFRRLNTNYMARVMMMKRKRPELFSLVVSTKLSETVFGTAEKKRQAHIAMYGYFAMHPEGTKTMKQYEKMMPRVVASLTRHAEILMPNKRFKFLRAMRDKMGAERWHKYALKQGAIRSLMRMTGANIPGDYELMVLKSVVKEAEDSVGTTSVETFMATRVRGMSEAALLKEIPDIARVNRKILRHKDVIQAMTIVLRTRAVSWLHVNVAWLSQLKHFPDNFPMDIDDCVELSTKMNGGVRDSRTAACVAAMLKVLRPVHKKMKRGTRIPAPKLVCDMLNNVLRAHGRRALPDPPGVVSACVASKAKWGKRTHEEMETADALISAAKNKKEKKKQARRKRAKKNATAAAATAAAAAATVSNTNN